MATIETKTTEVRCDRCDRKMVKPRERVGMGPKGPTCEPGAGPQSIRMLGLCKPCEDSLRKWWSRPSKDDESEAAQ